MAVFRPKTFAHQLIMGNLVELAYLHQMAYFWGRPDTRKV